MKDYKLDPSLNILHKEHHNLDYIFHPKTIALIGASEKPGSVGRTILWNLLRSPFGGIIYPVNPKHKSILGIKAYPAIKDVPEKVDLVVIATPSKTVPGIIKECADCKVSAAVIISAGFRELGEDGIKLEKEALSYARQGKMRVVGPNCLGVMNPICGLNATFAADMALKGNIAFISQSGALCTAVLDWSLKEKVGFSAFVSIGSMLDVNWGDLIDYFGNDPNTQNILIYMESIGDPRSFLSAAREVALSKPIILIKAGRTEASAKAAASHTGSLAGSDDVFSAALRRVGVLRVNSISDLFSMAEILSKQPRPLGPNLAILTNAGGPGVIATDAVILNGGEMAKLDNETIQKLNSFLPAEWSHNNPIDILGDATDERYKKSVEVLVNAEEIDGMLIILTPQYMTDAGAIAETLIPFAKTDKKPILASWMGAQSVREGKKILAANQIPTFEYPDEACKAFSYMWSYSYNLKGLYETPISPAQAISAKKQKARTAVLNNIVNKARKEKRTILDEYESKQIIKAYDIPIVDTEVANTEEEAVSWAKKIGFPVALKLYSKTVTHKTDVGGVKLNLNCEGAVEQAFAEIKKSVEKLKGKEAFDGVTVQSMVKVDGYELILGSSIDNEFGPVILFGAGGELVEVFKDSSIALPPLTTTLARRMMEQTKIYEALKGVRGKKGVNLSQLELILVKFSNLIAEHPEIKECDINPLAVSNSQIIALDARIILFDPDVEQSSYPKLAIRPYPIQYIHNMKLKDSTEITIRPLKPEDEPQIVVFIKDLSENSIRQRYLKTIPIDDLMAHDRLSKICFNDYDREIALIVEKNTPKKQKELLGVARLTKMVGTNDATFAILVKDKYQNQGIGSKLLSLILEIAKNEHIDYLFTHMFEENIIMQKLCQRMNFALKKTENMPIICAELCLNHSLDKKVVLPENIH